jgi:hypothetical protein
MSHHRRESVPSATSTAELFSIPGSPAVDQLQTEQVVAYVAALEARCNTLWGYIQGYDCSCDPVVRFLADELGITIAHAADAESGPAAD